MAKKRRKKQPVKKQPNRLRLLFVILGPLLIAHSVYWYWGNQIKANFIAHESNTSVTYENAPVSITIQSSDTPISVIPGGIYDGQWLLSDSQALYLPSSGKLGEGYNTVLYAHNTPALFGPLKKTSIGDRLPKNG
jgi:hypothetical protein